MKNIFKLFLIVSLVCVSGCESLDLEQTEDPSGVSASLLDPVYVFNSVQLQLPNFVDSANDFTQRITRQMAMTGGNNYDSAFKPVNFNENWNIAYSMLNAIKVMEPKAIASQEFYALGASKVIRCYVLMTLVDLYGDIPVTEALQGNLNLTPRFDNDADVYKQILIELDDAIATLGQPNSPTSKVQDLFYTSPASWVTLANTLKLKLYNNARLAGNDIGVSDMKATIDNLLAAGNIIDSPEKDFAFQYGNLRFDPNTRHPLYNDQYELGGGAYIGNYIMWSMTTEKGFNSTLIGSSPVTNTDPRVNFYFFRQDANPADEDTFTLPNRSRPEHYNDAEYDSFYNPGVHTPYTVSNWIDNGAIPSGGFWGRDHGDNTGIPPDAEKRTVGGLYPIGGTYGAPTNVQTSGNKGALGAGIMPILLSSWVHFMKAEAMLTGNATGDARAELKIAMEQSINKVTNFIPEYVYTPKPTATALAGTRDNYVTFMLNKYDNVSANDQLEIIIKEYYIAAWGNGIEPYNNYRRTGFPSNFQPTIEPVAGDFFNSAYYSLEAVNNNPNTPNNNRTRRVFWDKANLILH